MNLGKCEVVPVAGEGSAVQRSLFEGYKWIASECFTLLGAAIGSEAFCTEHMQARANKAIRLREKLSELENPQLAYLLVRHCASFCRVAYSTRVVPPQAHQRALDEYDGTVRRTFSSATGVLLDDGGWARAQLSARLGGLGLRSAARHAEAAYLSSLASAMDLAARIDEAFDADSIGVDVTPALQRLNEKLPPDKRVDVLTAEAPGQRSLSESIDSAQLESWLLSPDTPRHMKAPLRLISQDGAGAWLHATPTREDDTEMAGELFKVAVKRRVRVHVLEREVACPCCGAAMDIWGDHALVCPCKGDRTLRHNALRNLAYLIASIAGLRPEKEKPGLLPPRPNSEQLRGEDAGAGRRRPADVWIPQWHSGTPAAWDFAVTSALQSGSLQEAAAEPSAAAASYEQHKRTHLDTAAQCRQQGLEFVPVVAEAHSGTWGPTARAVWHSLAKSWASAAGLELSFTSAKLAQRMSTTLRRANARAILRRLPAAGTALSMPSAEGWMEVDVADFDGD